MARNRRLADACHQWAFCALTRSSGARAYYWCSVNEERRIIKRFELWPIDWSGSCMVA
jgi:hypothetical protein